MRKAILSPDTVDLTKEIHEEKYQVSPNCATCAFPCGNTSDYPAEAIGQWSDEQRQLKDQILRDLHRIVPESKAGEALPDIVWKAIGYLGYDLQNEAYQALLEDMKEW